MIGETAGDATPVTDEVEAQPNERYALKKLFRVPKAAHTFNVRRIKTEARCRRLSNENRCLQEATSLSTLDWLFQSNIRGYTKKIAKYAYSEVLGNLSSLGE